MVARESPDGRRPRAGRLRRCRRPGRSTGAGLREALRAPAAGLHGARRLRAPGRAAADAERQGGPAGLAAHRARARHRRSIVAPRTPTEEILAALWGEVLGPSGPAAGSASTTTSSSSAATRCSPPGCLAAVRDVFGVELPLRARLRARRPWRSWPPRARSGRRRAGRPSVPRRRRCAPRRRGCRSPSPRSGCGSSTSSRPAPSPTTCRRPCGCAAPLDVAALRRSLAEIVRRHEALRTTFAVAMGQPVQRIEPSILRSLPGCR